MTKVFPATEEPCNDCILKLGEDYKYYNHNNARLYPIQIVSTSEDKTLLSFIISENENMEVSVELFHEQEGILWGIATGNMKLVIPCTKHIDKLSDYIYDTDSAVYYIKPVFNPNPTYNRHNKKNILSEYKVTSINKFLLSFPYRPTVCMIGDFCEISTSEFFTETILIDKDGDIHTLESGKKLLGHNRDYMILYYKCPLGVRKSIPNPHGKWKESLREGNLRSLPKIGLYHYLNFKDPIFLGHYSNMEFVTSNIILVQREKQFGLINVEGNIIIPVELDTEKILCDYEADYIEWGSISEYGLLAIHKLKEEIDLVGFINKEGHLVIPIDFEEYKGPFADGTVKLLKEDTIITMNAKGELVRSESRYAWKDEARIDNW